VTAIILHESARLTAVASPDLTAGRDAELAGLMTEAGLTHGAFYRHFASKDDLLVEALEASLSEMARLCDAVLSTDKTAGLAPVIEFYLSHSHRDGVENGCPFAALGSELARRTPRERLVVTSGLLDMIEVLAAASPGRNRRQATRDALVAFSTLLGAITLARIVSDDRLSKEILAAAKTALIPKRRVLAKNGRT
jgi:TetR/AcrR family transcriptional repressor of nem operon